jgi:uncharacterized protein (TIGR02453 family)
MPFAGFPPEAFRFYEALEADNTKAFWTANRGTYDNAVRAPLVALCEELSDHGPFHVFRPYNDARFARNRPPYKTAQGAVAESEGGASYYVQVSADGLLAGAGYYAMASDQLERFRAAVDAPATGTAVEALVDGLADGRFTVGARDELKTAPRGFPRDHPRIELLRRKGLMASRSWPVARWMHTRSAVTRIRDTWTAIAPLCEWLDAHVGPTTLPPPDAER